MLSLLELLHGSMLAEVTPVAARELGESEQATGAALDLVVPVALGAMLQRCAAPAQAADLYRTVQGRPLDATSPDMIAARVDAARADGALQTLLFDDRAAALANALARITGVRPQSATRLVDIGVAALVARLKSIAQAERLDEGSFAARLLGERPRLLAALDRRLISALGGTGADAFLTHSPSPTPAITAVARTPAAVAPRRTAWRKVLPWTVVGAAMLLLSPLLRGCDEVGGGTAVGVEQRR